jgi:hypothetical protein
MDPLLVVRRVIETPMAIRRGPLTNDAAAILATTRPSVCVADESDETLARRNLVLLAIDARARGVAVRRAHYRPIVAMPAEGERVRDGVRSAIINELTTALADQGIVPLVPAIFRSSSAICSTMAR